MSLGDIMLCDKPMMGQTLHDYMYTSSWQNVVHSHQAHDVTGGRGREHNWVGRRSTPTCFKRPSVSYSGLS